MVNKFYIKQNIEDQKLYINLLQITGALSNLFAETETPFLYYRAMENIFCKAFRAKNLSRSDVSIDATKNKLGIGLKTFLNQSGKTYQKISEFNKESYLIRNLQKQEIAVKVAQMRNQRIDFTKRLCDLDDVVYHLITRHKGSMSIYEEHMDYIDVDKIKIISNSGKNTIHFTDDINDYTFSISKSTLFKRFEISKLVFVEKFNVNILDDPYDFLLSQKSNLLYYDSSLIDYIILPLYSPKSKKVEARSGLNMWNAEGRVRDENEVYISIPSWIHKIKPKFFTYKNREDRKTNPFKVILPNDKELSMKVTQQGGKALQSDPNKELGKWILRDVLNLNRSELVTKEILDERGIDSVRLSKKDDNTYYLDFLSVGSFEKYYNKMYKKIDKSEGEDI